MKNAKLFSVSLMLLAATAPFYSASAAEDTCYWQDEIAQYSPDQTALPSLFVCKDNHLGIIGISFCIDREKCANNDKTGWGWLDLHDILRAKHELYGDGIGPINYFSTLFTPICAVISYVSNSGITINRGCAVNDPKIIPFSPAGPAHDLLVKIYTDRRANENREAARKLSKRIVQPKAGLDAKILNAPFDGPSK